MSTNATPSAKRSKNFNVIPRITTGGFFVGRKKNIELMRIMTNLNSVGPMPLYEILKDPLRYVFI